MGCVFPEGSCPVDCPVTLQPELSCPAVFPPPPGSHSSPPCRHILSISRADPTQPLFPPLPCHDHLLSGAHTHSWKPRDRPAVPPCTAPPDLRTTLHGEWPVSVKLRGSLSLCGQARVRREPPHCRGGLGGRREPALRNGEGLGPPGVGLLQQAFSGEGRHGEHSRNKSFRARKRLAVYWACDFIIQENRGLEEGGVRLKAHRCLAVGLGWPRTLLRSVQTRAGRVPGEAVFVPEVAESGGLPFPSGGSYL